MTCQVHAIANPWCLHSVSYATYALYALEDLEAMLCLAGAALVDTPVYVALEYADDYS